MSASGCPVGIDGTWEDCLRRSAVGKMGERGYLFLGTATPLVGTDSARRVFSVLSTWVTRPSWMTICTEPKRMASTLRRTTSIQGSATGSGGLVSVMKGGFGG